MKKNEIMPFAEKNDWNWSSLFLSGTLRKKKKDMQVEGAIRVLLKKAFDQ
jgi:hypothetical protein